jgi:PhnB protein
MKINPIPENQNPVSPYFIVKNIDTMVNFLISAFDGEIIERLTYENGNAMHAEVKYHDTVLMIGKASEEFPATVNMNYIYVENVDHTFEKALKAGGAQIIVPEDRFYGNRDGGIKDPDGNIWWIGSRVEILTQEELEKRARKS